MWTFTIPKLLRPFFLHRRALLGSLCRAAWGNRPERAKCYAKLAAQGRKSLS